jgi:hypothetical protein
MSGWRCEWKNGLGNKEYFLITCASRHILGPSLGTKSARVRQHGEWKSMAIPSSRAKLLGDDHSEFWAAATKVVAFVAICLATLLLITVEVQCGLQPPSPTAEDFLFD